MSAPSPYSSDPPLDRLDVEIRDAHEDRAGHARRRGPHGERGDRLVLRSRPTWRTRTGASWMPARTPPPVPLLAAGDTLGVAERPGARDRIPAGPPPVAPPPAKTSGRAREASVATRMSASPLRAARAEAVAARRPGRRRRWSARWTRSLREPGRGRWCRSTTTRAVLPAAMTLDLAPRRQVMERLERLLLRRRRAGSARRRSPCIEARCR